VLLEMALVALLAYLWRRRRRLVLVVEVKGW
jgi:hypothetical protein